jgi:hypothetical protein
MTGISSLMLFYSSFLYLMTLSINQIIQLQAIQFLVNNELGSTEMKAVMA